MNKIEKVDDLQHVDSLVESAYNSARAFEWCKNAGGMPRDPCPSMESFEDFDLFSQSDGSDESKDSVDLEAAIRAAGRLTMTTKSNPLDDMKMAMLGFEPGFSSLNSSSLIAKIKGKIAELHGHGTVIPESTTRIIYKRLCTEFKTAPINIFKHYNQKSGSLEFDNYGLNATQALPITFILPYLTDMEVLKMKFCNLADEAAANIIESTLGGASKLRKIDFTGIQMGEKFIAKLSEAL